MEKKQEKHKNEEREEQGERKQQKKKNYMLLIIFMVLIFNSLSSPKTKKQQHMNYLRQAQKKIMQWLHPFFPGGSVIVHDEQPHPHPHPHPVWKRQGTLAEIFAKMMCFLKQGKKRGGHLILAYINLSLFHKASG